MEFSQCMGSRDEAQVGGLGTSLQKLKRFADIVYRFDWRNDLN